jgi:hypothetical protein
MVKYREIANSIDISQKTVEKNAAALKVLKENRKHIF